MSSKSEDTIYEIPSDDVLVMLCDCNARVGVLKDCEEEWHDVIGKHGLDERNEASEQFCALNQLTVMNTWFQRRESTMELGCSLQPRLTKRKTVAK